MSKKQKFTCSRCDCEYNNPKKNSCRIDDLNIKRIVGAMNGSCSYITRRINEGNTLELMERIWRYD